MHFNDSPLTHQISRPKVLIIKKGKKFEIDLQKTELMNYSTV